MSSSGAKILVVDDDNTIREFVSLALEDEGYQVSSAADGAAALAKISNHYQPDLILLDMRMPVMDGWAFARAYRQRPSPQAPIIVLTAATDAAAFATQIKADAYLAKPFDLDKLVEMVDRHLPPRT